VQPLRGTDSPWRLGRDQRRFEAFRRRVRARAAPELSRPQRQQLKQLGTAVEGVGDRPGAIERQRGAQAAIDFGHEQGAVRDGPAVELGQSAQALGIGVGAVAQGHPGHRSGPGVDPRPAARRRAQVQGVLAGGQLAEVAGEHRITFPKSVFVTV
jgi:hypothetical protein